MNLIVTFFRELFKVNFFSYNHSCYLEELDPDQATQINADTDPKACKKHKKYWHLFTFGDVTYRNPGDPAESGDGRGGRAQPGVHQVQQAPEHGPQAVPGEDTVRPA